ncbi:hyaluronan mediated motility receptor isoform X1 [Anolis carolinensis]|uniref:hyaluronan mediated motility receptor isoform X1 n=1 Tax=Anolis carolinensis TaxID=28377 RepID=UPI002F2B7D40
MSFPRAPLRRFNEAPACAPPPGSYDVKTSDASKGPISFEKSERFRVQTGDVETQPNRSHMKPPPSPANGRKVTLQKSKKPNSSGMKVEKDLTVLKDMKKQKELEKEIRLLTGERSQQDKRLQALEEDLAKAEAKLCAVVREKTSLLENVASLKKQLLDLSRTNELLKTKCFEDGTQKKMSTLMVEVMKLRHRLTAKRVTFVRQRDMESKPNATQEPMEHSKEKVAQLEEQLMEMYKQAEEKYDSLKLLEYITELGNVAEQVGDKYNLDIAYLEEIIEAKNKNIETLQSALQQKETMLSTQVEEMNEKCKMAEEQKEKMLTEYEVKKQTMNVEMECLKEQLNLEKQEQQKQKEAYKEISATMQQKLFALQEEMVKERQILERELRETMDEVDKLHAKDGEAEKLLKDLDEKVESQDEKIAQLEAKLERKNATLKKMTELHSNAIEKKQKEHTTVLCKLGETTAEFEIFKACAEKEIACLKEEKITMEEKLLQMSKAIHQKIETIQELQHAKQKAKEEFARMLLDAQTKIALKDAEIKQIKESSAMQLGDLQAKLEDQTEDFKKQLEIERKTIAEKLEADYKESTETWRILYEDLFNKVRPFQQQLDAYEAEKNALLNEHGAAQEELNKISDAYAKLLGHQNQKQKIKHVIKLKEENTQLKQEISKLRFQLAKEKQVHEELQEKINQIQGVKQFDPSKAFQHIPKENVPPKTPFKESNRRTTKLLSTHLEQIHT